MELIRFTQKRRSQLLLFLIIVTVTSCSLLMACNYGITGHELPIFWNYKVWPWWQESNGMLSYLLYKVFWMSADQKLETTELMIRLPICALVPICLLLTYKLGNALARKMGSRCPWGLYGSFMLGINCSFLAHSFHCRFYVLNMVMVLLATMALLRTCEKRTWLSLPLYLLSIWGCIASMMLSALLVGPHLVYYVLSAPRPRQATIQGLVILLGSLAFFSFLVYEDPNGFQRFNYMQEEIGCSTLCCLGYMGSDYTDPAMPLFHQGLHFWETREPAVWAAIVVTVVAWIAVGWQLLKNRQGFRLTPDWLCPLTLAWAILFYPLFSACVKSIDTTPNYSWILPFWGLVFGQAIADKRWLRYVTLVTVIAAVPYTHISFLVARTSVKNALVTLANQRQSREPVLYPCVREIRYYMHRELGESQVMEGNVCEAVSRAWQQAEPPFELDLNRACQVLGHVQKQHREKPQHLWVVEDSTDLRESRFIWLNEQVQEQRLSFVVATRRYPLDVYRITLWPCAGGESIFWHPAPTPLRGHSTLKFLHRCL